MDKPYPILVLDCGWKNHSKCRPLPKLAVEEDTSSIFCYDMVSKTQAHSSSRAGFFNCQEIIYNSIEILTPHSYASILDRNQHIISFLPTGKCQDSIATHSLNRIDDEIKKYLLKLSRICKNLLDIIVGLSHYNRSEIDTAHCHFQRVLEHIYNIYHL